VAVQFRTTIMQSAKNATGIVVPGEVIEALGSGRRPAVTVTLNGGYTYRSTVGVVGGVPMISLSTAPAPGWRGATRSTWSSTPPRARWRCPPTSPPTSPPRPRARDTFDKLSSSNRSWHVLQVAGATTDEIRRRRTEKSVGMPEEGRLR